MQEGRWTTVTPSRFDPERAALDHVRRHLPDTEPYRAWSNFTFTAETGHVHEVDLLVAAPSGLYLIEIKSLRGRLTSSGANWILTNQSTRTFDNPLHLADLKAKRLRSLLAVQAARQGAGRIPFIQGAVFLSEPALKVALADHQRHWVFGPEPAPGQPSGALPGIWSGMLRRPPRQEHHRLTPTGSRELSKLLAAVGIARSRRYHQVGSWQLDPEPFDVGPTWQDYLAHHAEFPHEHRRVRIYLVERNAAKTERASIERAARREMLALHGISHPGIVQVDTMEPHEGGPALIFRHDPRAIRLDHFVAQLGDRLDTATRVGIIRQLAEAVAYAHGRRLHHRALSARSVFVLPGRAARGESADDAWLRPQVQVSDWQLANRGADSAGRPAAETLVSSLSRLGLHLEHSAEAYLAPELSTADPDPVALDIFGLGTLSYLLLAGHPPTGGRGELLTRLAQEDGLRPSSSADSVSEFMDELVQVATRPVPVRRLSSVAEFLELLDTVEDELTVPPVATAEPAAAADPLEARVGDVISDWRIVKKLGTGSTSRAFLAENQRSGVLEVLKVALSDEKASRLVHEAEVLRGIHKDSRVIRLARPDPIEVRPRTLIVLEHAGDRTLARKLREDGRLTVDELETYADYLFGAVDHLQGEGVYHRDIKPDNIAIRVRPNRTRQLVLFDFSLASVPVQDIEAGTPRYLDPFLGSTHRPVYDDHAEWYALAVTLHEMASGELPVWGDGATEPRYTEGPPVLAVEAFDPAIRDGLAAFFERALHRDPTRRFPSLKELRNAWLQVFRRSDHTAPVGSRHSDDAEVSAAERDEAARKATRATALEASGLTPRAVSAAHRLGATTVADLLAKGSKELFTLPGLGAKTRQELQRRVREWRARLGEPDRSPLATGQRTAATAEVEAALADAATGSAPAANLARMSLDTVTARLVPAPQRTGRNRTEVEAIRLLLGLPDEAGNLPDLPPWPQQPPVAEKLGVTASRVAQILITARRRWHRDPLVGAVRSELIDLLADHGRVMTTSELAAALLLRRGSTATGDRARRAAAMAAVRAAVEIDPLAEEPRLLTRRHAGSPPRADRLLIALEVGGDDSPDTPAAPALLDHADALGAAADRLAGQDVLPSPATVLRELAAAGARADAAGFGLDDRRTVQLAAAASASAAASPRLEIYPLDLDPVRALRLAQAGVVPRLAQQAGQLSVEQVQERVRARFPELAPLPDHPRLGQLLAAAGFDLMWEDGHYRDRPEAGSSTRFTPAQRRSTTATPTVAAAESPELAAAARTERQLASAAAGGGFRVLTVRTDRYALARGELERRFGTRVVAVAGQFVAHLRALVAARPKPSWEKVLAADAADPNSRDALKLAEFTDRAWQALRPELMSMLDRRSALLLCDAAPMARYRAMGVLEDMAEAARGGQGTVWLLCPMDDARQAPRLDTSVVPVPEYEWIPLPDGWATNAHRASRAA